jgi:hypothetical protein
LPKAGGFTLTLTFTNFRLTTLALMKKELWLRLRGYCFDDLVPAHLTDHVAEATMEGAGCSVGDVAGTHDEVEEPSAGA